MKTVADRLCCTKLQALVTGFLDLSTTMTLNDLEPPKEGLFVNCSRFRPATHILRMNCTEMAGDRLEQPAKRNCQCCRASHKLCSNYLSCVGLLFCMSLGRPLSCKPMVGLCHDCRPSVCPSVHHGYTVTKRCKIGSRLLLITNRKSHNGFQITCKSSTLDDREGQWQSVRSVPP